MRILLVLALGVALGALASSAVLNALNRRDAYARGVMEVLQHQVAGLRNRVRTNTCTGASLQREKSLLAELTEEIEPSIFADSTPDPPFREYAQHLREAVAELPTEAAGCAALAPVVTKIGNTCDACHHQYR
jgi:hypothetical protein